MSAAQLGGVTATTLVMLVIVMLIVVIFGRLRAERQWIVYTVAYLLALFFSFGIPANVDVDGTTIAAVLVLALTIWSYRRTMRRKAKAAPEGIRAPDAH